MLGFARETHQQKHAAAFLYGTAASQEPQNHDGGTHSNQDIHTNVRVDASFPTAEKLKTEKRNQKNPFP